jgi:Putative peptidoglycan binding domain
VTRGKRTGLSWAAGTVGLAALALVAAGAAIGAVLLPEQVSPSLGPAQGDRFVAVSTESYDGARKVQLTPEVTESTELTVTDSGRITASTCAPGTALVSGSSPLTVDDRPVLALATPTPLWRDLDVDARGPDVRALQEELARLGHPVKADGVYGTRTRDAVKALMRGIGVERPTGALPVASVLWLPAQEVRTATCAVRPGDRLTDGVVAEVAGGLTSLKVADPAEGEWVVRYRDVTAPVPSDGKVVDPTFLAAVEAGPELELALSDDGSGTIDVEYAWAAPADVAVVPPSAVTSLAGGAGCVVTEEGVKPVTVVSSALGQTLVSFDGPLPARVDTRPAAGTTCR